MGRLFMFLVLVIKVTAGLSADVKPDLSALRGKCDNHVQELQMRNRQLEWQSRQCDKRLTLVENERNKTISVYQTSLRSAEEQLTIALDSISMLLDQQYNFLLSLRKLKKTGGLPAVPLTNHLMEQLATIHSLIDRLKNSQPDQNSGLIILFEEQIGLFHSSFSDFVYQPSSKEFTGREQQDQGFRTQSHP